MSSFKGRVGKDAIVPFPINYEIWNGCKDSASRIKRFPPDFMFQLTKEELKSLKHFLVFQNGISNEEAKKGSGILRVGRGGTQTLPYAFTEQGLAMLSGVLKSDIAIEVNIAIMRTFVAIRRMTSVLPQFATTSELIQLRKDFEELKQDIEDILHNQNDINEDTRAQLDAISLALSELQAKEPPKPKRNPIGFK